MNEIIDLKDELIDSVNSLSSDDFFLKMFSALQGETAVLIYIYRHNCFASPSSISKALQITKARVTAVSNSLIDKGLIKLERNQADRRKVDLFLTDKGIQKIEDDIEMLNKRVSYVLDELGEEKVRGRKLKYSRLHTDNNFKRIEKNSYGEDKFGNTIEYYPPDDEYSASRYGELTDEELEKLLKMVKESEDE